MINGLNNTNSAASIVLDAANKVNNGFTKSWNDMSCAEKLLKILSLGLWSPKYSPSEKQEYQELLSVLKPVSPKSNELGRVYAQFSDGSSLRISVTRSELIEAEIITPDNKRRPCSRVKPGKSAIKLITRRSPHAIHSGS